MQVPGLLTAQGSPAWDKHLTQRQEHSWIGGAPSLQLHQSSYLYKTNELFDPDNEMYGTWPRAKGLGHGGSSLSRDSQIWVSTHTSSSGWTPRPAEHVPPPKTGVQHSTRTDALPSAGSSPRGGAGAMIDVDGMLLRLLGPVLMSVLSTSMLYNPPEANQNATDNTKMFNNGGNFSNKGLGKGIQGSNFLGRSLLPVMAENTGIPLSDVMFPDTSICDVILSSSEPISIDQIPFFCLCSHCKSTTGPKGERGDRGPSGFPGSPGRRGLNGFRGPRGFTGALGAKGQKGDQGEKGQPGPIGLPGIKGEMGFKGEKGDDGDDGPAGPLGPQGVPGSCHCDIVIGPPGVQGPPGPAGARGLPGSTGSKGGPGVKGDKGDTGLNGINGLNGLKGEKGSPGPCDCPDGVDGADGPKGETGEKGEKGDVGAQGVHGETGFKGEPGDMGIPGMPGPCSLAVQSAFSVALAEPFPEPSRPVRFTKIISNVHSHYNPLIGIYIAPVNGTYVFTFNLLVKERHLIVGLFHNFGSVVRMTEKTDTNTVSQEIVLHLDAKDMVWVQVKDSNNNGMYAGPEMTSTFSGWLLTPDTCDFGGIRDFPHHKNVTGLQFPWTSKKFE
ncbi:inner ear-specific collagen-like [Boleophthalmus pectinirostris]|uniref:inner ear-specific collagen-like n=1 Tax=Boleophthalmus pectinirostris TaxID=150288 RepID=UPI002431439E|nr:inner ear-specific collagen-like [Boleophthalmus pectinirostris]